ncbi:MAG: SDR family oxidoreductase [Cyanobium sp.]
MTNQTHQQGEQRQHGQHHRPEGQGEATTASAHPADTGVSPLAGSVKPPVSGPVLVLGGGYSGRRFAAALRANGLPVTLTRRSDIQDSETPSDDGCRWLRFDPAAGVVPDASELAGFAAVLVTIPPDASGRDPVLQHLGDTLQQLAPPWVGYLSTTGVYGDSGGAWVDEDSPTRAGLPRSIARLACEQAWRQLNLPLQVFRLPAIYGPGRSPLDHLREGTARHIHKPGQVFSRIHVDDIVGALLHCLALPAADRPDTLILADRCPCPSSEMLGYAAHLLGCPLPPVQSYAAIAATLSPMARSFWSENRRASGRRLREQLGYSLRYPTYREGLQAIRLAEVQRLSN